MIEPDDRVPAMIMVGVAAFCVVLYFFLMWVYL